MKTWIISFHPPCIRPCSHSECTWSDTQLHTEKKLLKKKRPWGEGIWRTGELSIKFHRWPFPSGKVICSCPVTQPSHRQDFSHRHQHFPKRCSSGQEKKEHPKRRFAGHFKAWEPRKPTGCCQTLQLGQEMSPARSQPAPHLHEHGSTVALTTQIDRGTRATSADDQ